MELIYNARINWELTDGDQLTQRFNILQSKLTAPRLSHTLSRGRLVSEVNRILQKKLVLIIAGAGYGKTTVAAQALSEIPGIPVWYHLDAYDNDVGVFLSYLIAGIKNHIPGFGGHFLRQPARYSRSSHHLKQLLTEFLLEIENRIPDDLIIVLDDYHQVRDCVNIKQAMEFILARLPSSLHFVITSRTNPGLELSRYRAALDVIEINEPELAFPPEEAHELLSRVLKTDVDPAMARQISAKTEGWITGLILYYQSLIKTPSPQGSALVDIENTPAFVFEYLEENVLSELSEGTRKMMMHASLLPRIDPEFCDTLFGFDGTRTLMEQLHKKHLLTFLCGGNSRCYEYHQLLQDFLHQRLERLVGPSELARLRYNIGVALEKSGDIHGALMNFLKGRRYHDVARIITGLVFSDFGHCAMEFLINAFRKIPSDIIQNDPHLIHIEARLASLQGDIRTAQEKFEIALERFKAENDEAGISGCMKDLGLFTYQTGDILGARRHILELTDRKHEDPFFNVEITGYLILFNAIVGDFIEADRCYASSRHLTNHANPTEKSLFGAYLDFCYSYRFLNAGDFAKSNELNSMALEVFTQTGFNLFLPLTHFQLSLTLYYQTKYDQGFSHAEEGLAWADRIGIYDGQYAWLLYARALNNHKTGDAEAAKRDALSSLGIFKDHNNLWGQAANYELLSMIESAEGNDTKAANAAINGLGLIEGKGLVITKGALLLRLAEIRFDMHDIDTATKILEKNRGLFAIQPFYRYRYHLLRSNIFSHIGKNTDAVSSAKEALKLSEQYGYSQRIGSVLSILSRKHLSPLRISCLGKFRVVIGDRLIPSNKWRNTRAARIFKYLALNHDRGFTSKDILIELLWPDDNPDAANRRFHVAMTSLRKILEPNLKRGESSSYIIRQNNAYRLQFGKGGHVDVGLFMLELDGGEKAEHEDTNAALTHYLKAESLYKAPLLIEDIYDETLTEKRDHLNSRYLLLLSRIIELYEKKAEWSKCIQYAEKYIQTDAYAESVYRSLMQFYFNQGHFAQIFKIFGKCRASLVEDLGIALDPDTEELFKVLTRQRHKEK